MKISKTANAAARRMFRLAQTGGRLDEAKLSAAISELVAGKGRDYRSILVALQRLVRLELDRHHVVVESAVELDQASRDQLVANLGRQHGDQLSFEYRINPELLGGLKIRVGNDVWDGSVKGRLDRLAQAF